MKFRLDYVTNSSSTGYVVVTVKTKEGYDEARDNYDTGYGGWIWNYRDINNVIDDLNAVQSGADLYKVLKDSVERFDYFAKGPGTDLPALLNKADNRDDLIEITMEEDTSFDDSDPYHFYMKYDFGQSEVIELERGYYNDHAGDYEYVKNAIAELSDEELLDLNADYFEGSEYDVIPMKVFKELYPQNEQESIISQLKENGKHFDSDDKYFSIMNGSSNDEIKLIDIDALIEEIANDEDGCDYL